MSLINTADILLNNTHVVNLNSCIQNKLGHIQGEPNLFWGIFPSAQEIAGWARLVY